MTDKEIVTKAVEKIIEAGNTDFGVILRSKLLDDDIYPTYFIFSHDFAKAFWGEDRHTIALYIDNVPKGMNLAELLDIYDKTGKIIVGDSEVPYEKMEFLWQHHLKMMVLEENPVKYLEQFLDD